MSWSLAQAAPKAEARETFARVHHEQYAYENDRGPRVVMDKIAAFAADIAEGAPDGTVTALESSGHIYASGAGSCRVNLSFYPPAK